MGAPSDRRLVPLLLGLTLLSGIVDAVSYLRLGHVFVANMTGNVVFLGFAVAGAGDVDLIGQLLALVAFIAGAVGGGRLATAVGHHRGRHLMWSAWVSAAVVGAALVIAIGAGHLTARGGIGAIGAVGATGVTRVLAGTLALAMGLQSATARKLAVADMTTSVVTMTIAGFASGLWSGDRRDRTRQTRRAGAVVAIFGGALAGGSLTVHAGVGWAIGSAQVVATATALAVTWSSRNTRATDWQP